MFLLGVMAGLRRREIDTLEWSAFRWERATVRSEPTKWFHPKSEDSIGDVVDPELIEVFREYHAKAKGCFVIDTGCALVPYQDSAELELGIIRSKPPDFRPRVNL